MIFRRFLTPALVALFTVPSTALAQFDPLVEAFIGSGSKTAYLVLDFQSSAYTFGYRYDGVNVPAGDMIAAVDTALSSFSVDMPGDRNSGFGRFINGFGYGTNALGSFTSNFSTPPYFGWHYFISTSSLSTASPLWTESLWGVDGRSGTNPAGTLQNLDTHVWHGFSWGQYDTNTFAFLGAPPKVSAGSSAPEPGTLGLLALGAVGLRFYRRKRP